MYICVIYHMRDLSLNTDMYARMYVCMYVYLTGAC